MPRLAGKAFVDRVLARLDQGIGSSPTAADREQLCAAWVLAFQVFYQPKKPAFREVLRLYGILGGTQTQRVFGIDEQTEVDGRRGREWIASVLRYLEWRSRSKDGKDYVRDINFLNCQVPKYFPAGPSLTGCVYEGQQYVRDYMKITRRERRRRPRPVKKPVQKVALAKTAVA